jgi:succinoglycan biosynthesis protein ExoA
VGVADRPVRERGGPDAAQLWGDDELKNVTSTPGGPLPAVSVVIPVKRSERTIKGAVDGLLNQDYEGPLEIILVGDPVDSSWQAIRTEIECGDVASYEVDVDAAGRDTAAKRALGFDLATGDILCSMDSDAIPPCDWVRTGVELIRAGWDGVGGPYISATEDFWGLYVDRNPAGSKTPRMDPPYVFDVNTVGMYRHKPPVTGAAFLSRAVYERVGGFDKDFVNYEDYELFCRVAENGFRILCTSRLGVRVHHRTTFRALAIEYWESGSGCAQFVRKHPKSRFSRFRLAQLALFVGCIAAAPVQPAVVLTATGIAMGGVAVVSAATIRRRVGLVFPFVTVALGLVLATAFASGLVPGVRRRRPTTVGSCRRLPAPTPEQSLTDDLISALPQSQVAS